MDYTETERRISDILMRYITGGVANLETPIISESYGLDARSLASFFIVISDEFDLDLNDFFSVERNYSIKSISYAVHELCRHR